MQQLNTKRFFTGERTISNYHLKKQGRDILKNRQGYLTTGPMNLKKPTKTSKAKDHLSAPKVATFWNMKEKQLRKIQPKVINNLSGKFASFMHKGNVNSAIKLLKNKLLKEKHAEPAEVSEDIFFSNEPEFIHFV